MFNHEDFAVWYGEMPESSGRKNYTAILYNKQLDKFCDGITLDRSEYPDRVRWAADKARYLIGEIAERPHILAYDPNLKSDYVAPKSKAEVACELLESCGYVWNGREWLKP